MTFRKRLSAGFGCAQVTHPPHAPLIYASSRTHLSWSAFTPSARGTENNAPKETIAPIWEKKKNPFLALARLHSGSNLLNRDISYWLRMGIKGNSLFSKRQGGVFPSSKAHIFWLPRVSLAKYSSIIFISIFVLPSPQRIIHPHKHSGKEKQTADVVSSWRYFKCKAGWLEEPAQALPSQTNTQMYSCVLGCWKFKANSASCRSEFLAREHWGLLPYTGVCCHTLHSQERSFYRRGVFAEDFEQAYSYTSCFMVKQC